MVDAEWRVLYEKMEKMIESGANIVLSKLPIGKKISHHFVSHPLSHCSFYYNR
jgi:T-complex protein 1 subunit eta